MSLNFLAKYIKNKQANDNIINNLTDFDGMDDTIWNFISLVYKTKWDMLWQPLDIKSNDYTTSKYFKMDI